MIFVLVSVLETVDFIQSLIICWCFISKVASLSFISNTVISHQLLKFEWKFCRICQLSSIWPLFQQLILCAELGGISSNIAKSGQIFLFVCFIYLLYIRLSICYLSIYLPVYMFIYQCG